MPVRLNPHMHLNMTIQMLASTVRLRTPLVGAVEQGPTTPAIGVVCVRHVLLLLLLLMLLLLNVMSGLGRMLNYRRSRSCRMRSSRLNKKIKINSKYFPHTYLNLKSRVGLRGGGGHYKNTLGIFF